MYIYIKIYDHVISIYMLIFYYYCTCWFVYDYFIICKQVYIHIHIWNNCNIFDVPRFVYISFCMHKFVIYLIHVHYCVVLCDHYTLQMHKQCIHECMRATYILTYLHTYTHTYIHRYIHTYLATYLHTYIPTYLHTYLPTYLAYILTYLHTYLHTYILTYLHTYIHTYILTYLHTYIHTYLLTYLPTYIHTYIMLWLLLHMNDVEICMYAAICILGEKTLQCRWNACKPPGKPKKNGSQNFRPRVLRWATNVPHIRHSSVILKVGTQFHCT